MILSRGLGTHTIHVMKEGHVFENDGYYIDLDKMEGDQREHNWQKDLSGIYLWDMAAASLILERAGGTCSILKNYETPKYHIAFLATNGKLHDIYTQALLPLL